MGGNEKEVHREPFRIADLGIPKSNFREFTVVIFFSQRRMSTRGADKGVKEDIKTAMRRQMARSGESLEPLLSKFLTNERNLILHSIGRGK